MFPPPLYVASYFSVTNQEEKKKGDELKIRLEEGKEKVFFLSEIHEEKMNTTKFCKLSPLIERLIFIGTDIWNGGQYLAAS